MSWAQETRGNPDSTGPAEKPSQKLGFFYIVEEAMPRKIENFTPMQERARQRSAAKREKYLQLKGEMGCVRCGTHDPRVLDFHHRDPAHKIFGIGGHYTVSPRILLAEIAKCDVHCSNCHRILEWEKRHPSA